MKTTSLKIILCLTALFVSGGVCGVAVSKSLPASKADRSQWSEEKFLHRRFTEDVERLKLTPEQAEKFRDSYRRLGEDIRTVREETNVSIRSLFARHGKAVMPDLTPEQRKQYLQLIEERRASRKSS